MKQIFHTYDKWEDHKAGQYDLNDVIDKDIKVIKCIKLLSDSKLFYSVCVKILTDWPISCDVNLSNINKNRNAWLGAAACCYECNAPEYLTRIAWGLLNKDKQEKANKVANKIVKMYEAKNIELHTAMGVQMLF